MSAFYEELLASMPVHITERVTLQEVKEAACAVRKWAGFLPVDDLRRLVYHHLDAMLYRRHYTEDQRRQIEAVFDECRAKAERRYRRQQADRRAMIDYNDATEALEAAGERLRQQADIIEALKEIIVQM